MNHWPSTAEQGNAIKTRFDSLDLLKLINGQGHPSLPLVTRTDVVPFYWVLPSFTVTVGQLLSFYERVFAWNRKKAAKVKTDAELAAEKKALVNAKRRSHRIHVQGSDVPPPAERYVDDAPCALRIDCPSSESHRLAFLLCLRSRSSRIVRIQ